MQFKKNFLAASMLALALSVPAHAEDDAWGDVSGNTDPGDWGVTAVEETAPATLPVQQTEPGKPACGADDPRYAKLPQVLKELQAGTIIEPLQLSFPTYISLSPNVRGILGDNLYISSPDCSEQYLFSGELTGKVTVNFSDLWQIINNTTRTNDQELLNFVAQNTQAAPESALSVISKVQHVSLANDQVRRLYTAIAPEKINSLDIEKPLMLEVYLAFGGSTIESDRDKAVFIHDSWGDDMVVGLYLEHKEGSFLPSIREKNIVPLTSSLLSTAGLRPQRAKSEAKRLASQ